MPSKSKAQQKFMGMVHALQKGELDPKDVSQDVRDAAASMKKKDAKDFASTSHKGLPRKVKQEIINRLKEYANSMGRDHLGGDDYTSSKKGGLRDNDGYDNVDYNPNMTERADYKFLTQTILDAKPKYNVYYNSGHNKVNIGGVGYDKGELVKQFNQKPGSSSKIKNNFYYADQDPQKTKREVEKLSKGKIKVDIQKGYGGKPMAVYIVKESVSEGPVPQNWMSGRTSDYHTKLRGKKRQYDDTNFEKDNSGQPDLEETFDKVEHLKLLNLALRTMPGSQKQKEIIRKLNKVRKAGGMRPLKETFLSEYASKQTLSYIPADEEEIEKMNEGTMVRRAVDLAQELLPKDTWSRYASDGKKNAEFVKNVVRDLARSLNQFYKNHNINVRIHK